MFMSANPPPAAHQDDPGHQAADTHTHVLDGLINIGADLARLLHQQATSQSQAAQQRPAPQATAAQPAPPPAPDALIKITAAFDQAARAVRRYIALFRSLNEPMHPARNPAPNRVSHALPDDPAGAVAFVLHRAAQARWRPSPGA